MTDYVRKLAALDAGTLQADGFSHRDHVGVTVAALMQGDFYDALARVSRGLQNLTRRAGAPDKFNATLTFAFVSAIAEKMQPGCASPEEFLDRHPELIDLNPIAGLYPPERLKSPLARAVPVLPKPCHSM